MSGTEPGREHEKAQHARRRLWRTGAVALAVILAMSGVTAASPLLYEVFCRVTGYGGTTQRATTAIAGRSDTTVRVYFDAETARDLPWRFVAVQRSMDVRPGEQQLAIYTAENRDTGPVVGRAVYNVTPHKVGAYFAKLACFCFSEQTLEAGERVEMPVSFFVDPALLDDASTREVRQITLSYTFFIDEQATRALREKRAHIPQS